MGLRQREFKYLRRQRTRPVKAMMRYDRHFRKFRSGTMIKWGWDTYISTGAGLIHNGKRKRTK